MAIGRLKDLRRPLRSIAALVAVCVGGGIATGGVARADEAVVAATAPRFVPANEQAGILTSDSLTWGAYAADYDLDGDNDLFLGRHWLDPILYVSDGETTYAASGMDFGSGDRHTCSWGEANGDGRPDLFCTTGADRGRGRGPNQLWLQDPVGGFTDAAGLYGVATPPARGRSVNWIDYDLDGDLDLFVGNKYRAGYPNVMYENMRGHFRVAKVGLGRQLHTIASTWSDWDRDGDPDLVVLRYPPYGSVVYENAGGRFKETEVLGISGKQWTSAAWADLNADGRPDVALAGPTKMVILQNRPNGFKEIWSRPLVHGRIAVWADVNNDGRPDLFVVQSARIARDRVGGRNEPDFLVVNRRRRFVTRTNDVLRGPSDGAGDSVTAFDYDNDGRIDLLVTNGFKRPSGPVQLLRNETTSGSWVGIRLAYDPWNPWGFGSTVTVNADGHIYRHQVTDGMNLASQAPPGSLHFGIGNAASAHVVVTWPDGSRDCAQLTVDSETVVTATGVTCS